MNPAQIQGIIRFFMNAGGTWLLAHGVLSKDTWTQAAPYLEAIAGAALSLGSLAWNYYAHTPSQLGSHLAQTKDS